MKTCPICQTQFDDSMRFCLEDGTPLVAAATSGGSETETFERPAEIKPAEAVTEKLVVTESAARGRAPMLIAGAIGTLVLIGTVAFGIWEFQSADNRSAAPANINQTANLPANDLAGPAVGGISNISNPNSQTNTEKSETNQTTPEKTTPEPTPETLPVNKPSETPAPRPTRAEPPKTVSAGVINNRASSLPTPDYPAAARRAKASGRVGVQVLVDENGKVIRATAVSGHRLLRNSAVNAARRASFKPAESDGRPARMTGIIVYNFRP